MKLSEAIGASRTRHTHENERCGLLLGVTLGHPASQNEGAGAGRARPLQFCFIIARLPSQLVGRCAFEADEPVAKHDEERRRVRTLYGHDGGQSGRRRSPRPRRDDEVATCDDHGYGGNPPERPARVRVRAASACATGTVSHACSRAIARARRSRRISRSRVAASGLRWARFLVGIPATPPPLPARIPDLATCQRSVIP